MIPLGRRQYKIHGELDGRNASACLNPGDEIHVHSTTMAPVVDVVPVMEHDDEDRYGGLVMIRRLWMG